ncbi:nuclear transport factor 2 family protein [Prescottella equi]|uniref:nuclear transport factor 2 family protein n=1 Tax=Rhodococcus hoagii TaxID=43767 RepID=UPI0007CD701B|nr:nuclear transport factor 2 family protein [Prescottella equi]
MRADDINEIIRITHLYARGLDRFDPKEALSAFAPDGVWDASAVGLTRYEGHEQIRDFFERDAQAVDKQFHIITNHVIDFTDDDHATGTNYVFSEAEMKNGAAIKAIALNEDRYIRTADGWKIAERIIAGLTTPQMEGFDA